MSSSALSRQDVASTRLYRAVWRWHFYANFKKFTFAAALTLAALYGVTKSQAHQSSIGDLVIEHAWSRETKATDDVAAGFMNIVNNGPDADTLISVTATISDKVQLHNMRMNGDRMEMFEMADGIEIPADATVQLKPKSLHVMFFKIKDHPKQGDEFHGTLTFKKAGTVDVEFMVESPDAGME